jgi:hypothetical protein
MAKTVIFSDQELGLDEIAAHHATIEAALREYYSDASVTFMLRHAVSSKNEVERELSDRLAENEFANALNVLCATEAALRVDYLNRAYRKLKDPLSVAFRKVYKARRERASLDDDILAAWTDVGMMPKHLASALKSANNFRNWLAHGRYWFPNLGQKYDYFTVYGIAEQVFDFLDQNA